MNRRFLLPILALAAGLACPPAPAEAWQASQEAQGEIRGRILGRQGDPAAPIPWALVNLFLDGHHLTVAAGKDGAYRAEGLRAGRWRLRALHVGYEGMAVEVLVPPGGSVALDMELRWKPISLRPIRVVADPLRGPLRSDPLPTREEGELALRALEASTGMVEGGLAQVARSLPGHDPADPTDVLLMRGSATDLKLVLLDGAPLYTPFHMAGLVESFDPSALGGASLFLGGAPARFDGGLSYILDLRTRSPPRDRVRGSAAVDLLTGRALIQGPLTGSTSFLLGGRSIHNGGAPLLGSGSSPYGYGDLLGRLEWETSGGRQLYLTGFWNREEIILDLPGANYPSIAPDLGPGGDRLLAMAEEDEARWGNQALSVGFRGSWGEGTDGEIRVAASRYDANLPLADTLPLFAQGRSDRLRVTGDFSRPLGEGAIAFGGSFDRLDSSYRALALDTAQGPPPGTIVATRLKQEGVTGGGYLELRYPMGSSLRLRSGIRLDRYSDDAGIRFAPRVSLTWLLTDEAALTLMAGRYHQFSNLQSEEIEEGLDPANGAFGNGESSTTPMTVGSANHLVVTLDQILRPGLRLGLEGFVKDFHGVSGTEESLKASGVDLRVARDGERASGWLGYTLTWFWASDGILASGTSPFQGRHLLSAGLVASLTRSLGLRLRTSYGDGLPYTSIPVGRDTDAPSADAASELASVGDKVLNEAPGLATGPDEGFLRVEAEIFGIFSPTWGGRSMELRPYLRVLNALNRRDALFYHFDPWRSQGPEPLADLPILPLLGLEWRF